MKLIFQCLKCEVIPSYLHVLLNSFIQDDTPVIPEVLDNDFNIFQRVLILCFYLISAVVALTVL